jgi:hypothetical protein
MQIDYFARMTRVVLGVLILATLGAHADDKSPPLIGAWVGTYTCPQGLTGLTLSINVQAGDTFSGYFHFYPPVSNARAREGCYGVAGRIDAERRITIVAGRWITQPDGYVTVDLDGRMDQVAQAIVGSVIVPSPVGAQCTTFDLKAQIPAPKIAGICHAGVSWLPRR